MLERLNKLIARAGIASRRGADELIAAGEVSVNGEIVTDLGRKADPESDHIKVGGKLINPKITKHEKSYILLNKPKGYLSSAADPEGRPLVVDLVKGYGKLHPVGRLDFNTEGLLILTNDGEFTNLVAGSKLIPKVYEVKVKGLPNANAINKLRRGIRLDDGFKTAPAEIRELKSTDKNGWYEVTLYEGHNQQIRKMFDSVGHSVVKLRRTAIGSIDYDRLPIGAYRELDPDEVASFSRPIKRKPAKPPVEPSPRKSKPPARSKKTSSARPNTTANKPRRTARPKR